MYFNWLMDQNEESIVYSPSLCSAISPYSLECLTDPEERIICAKRCQRYLFQSKNTN